MKSIYKTSAFTLIELVVSIVISTIVLVIVFAFTGDTIANLVDVNRKSDSLQEVYRLTTILSAHKWKYIIPEILYDNPPGTGHDIFYNIYYMKDPAGTSWIIWAVIDTETSRIEDAAKYPYYGNKILGYRLLSEPEITALEADNNIIYDFDFFEDKFFNAFKVKEFQLELYNSGALIESNIEIIPHYKNDLNNIEWSDIPKDDTIKINLNI